MWLPVNSNRMFKNPKMRVNLACRQKYWQKEPKRFLFYNRIVSEGPRSHCYSHERWSLPAYCWIVPLHKTRDSCVGSIRTRKGPHCVIMIGWWRSFLIGVAVNPSTCLAFTCFKTRSKLNAETWWHSSTITDTIDYSINYHTLSPFRGLDTI